MKKQPIFRDAYEVTDGDLDDMVTEIKLSDDHIAYDAIQRGRRFTGFAVTQSSATQVNVGAGRLWFDGARYYSDDPGGVTLDLLALKPTLQKRIVAIVGWPETVDSDLEYRDYETDAETQVKEPRQVNVKKFRHTRLEAVGGAQAVSPQAPVVDASAVVLALVLVDTTGIVAITRNTAAELDNLGDVAGRVTELEDWRDKTDPQIATLASELARINALLAGLGNQELVYAIAGEVAEIKEKLNLPASYVNFRSEFFLDATDSDTAAAGYAAKTEEGLRFAPDAIAETALAIFNPYNPDVKVAGNGLLLPKYKEVVTRPVTGGGGVMSLAQYAYESRTATIKTMTLFRDRYGAEFEVSAGSAFFLGGTFTPGANSQTYTINLFKLTDGTTYQAIDTGKVDPDGHKIYRLNQFWRDSVATPYWSRVTSDTNLTGYAWVETFVQPRDGWCTALAPRIYQKPADGLLHVGLCECINGEAQIDRMIALVSAGPSHWTPGGGLGTNRIDIPPTFMKGGQRYGFVVMTAADYWVQTVETGTSPTTGTMFYGLNGGVFQSDPNRHLMFDMYFASFERNRIEVDLASLSLSGGIAAVDILAQGVVSEATSLTYEVQIGGVWQPLAETQASILDDLPPLLPLRAVFNGTADIMPGINLGNSRVRVSRPKTTLKHVSKEETLGSASSTIVVKSRLRNFDPVHHSHTVKILRGAGYTTVETADAVVDVVRGGITERTSTFNLAAAVTSYKRQIDHTADDASNLFVVDGVTDIAQT